MSVRIFRCPHHGDYRMYQASLLTFKNWCILWVTIALLPFGLIVHAAGLDLNWVILTGSIATIPCFPGVVLSLVWVKASAVGLVTGESALGKGRRRCEVCQICKRKELDIQKCRFLPLYCLYCIS